ncbi:MAG: hypothetical protein ABJG96_20730 [Paracoccaceae bacterium]
MDGKSIPQTVGSISFTRHSLHLALMAAFAFRLYLSFSFRKIACVMNLDQAAQSFKIMQMPSVQKKTFFFITPKLATELVHIFRKGELAFTHISRAGMTHHSPLNLPAERSQKSKSRKPQL